MCKKKGGGGKHETIGANDDNAVSDFSVADVSCIIHIFIGRYTMRRLLKDETGMGVVEVILIIVVLIGLVIIFQTQIKTVVNNIFKTITSKTGQVK